MKKMNHCESFVPLRKLGIRTLRFLRIGVLSLFVTFLANFASAKAISAPDSSQNRVQAEQQKRVIKGKVFDDTNVPVPGASVLVKGTTVGTITNSEGQYALDVPATAKTLVFSFVGMTTQEVVLDTRNEIDVVLKNETFGVDEVVVTALGIKRDKKTLTYASQQVSGEEMMKSKRCQLYECS